MTSTITLATNPYSRGPRLIVPLTSIWSQESGCPFPVADTFSTLSCVPPYHMEVWYNNGFYSPGICFNGYTVGFTTTSEVGATLNSESIRAGETAALCVPFGYTLGSTVSVTLSSYAYSVTFSTSTSGSVVSTSIRVPIYQIRWKASDLALLETPPVPGATPPPSTTVRSSQRTTTTPGPTPTGSRSSSEGDIATGGPSGLSPGAIGGIVAAIIILALVVAGFFFIRYRRNRRGGGGPQYNRGYGDELQISAAETKNHHPVVVSIGDKEGLGGGGGGFHGGELPANPALYPTPELDGSTVVGGEQQQQQHNYYPTTTTGGGGTSPIAPHMSISTTTSSPPPPPAAATTTTTAWHDPMSTHPWGPPPLPTTATTTSTTIPTTETSPSTSEQQQQQQDSSGSGWAALGQGLTNPSATASAEYYYSRASQSSPSPPSPSSSSAPPSNDLDTSIEELARRAAELRLKKTRLQEIQRLDEEEAAIQQRLSLLKGERSRRY